MIAQLTVENVLEKAIEKEIESQHLYRDLSRKMTNGAAKDAFQQLSQEELGHENLLRKYLRGELKEGALPRGQVLDYKIAEYLQSAGNISRHEVQGCLPAGGKSGKGVT